MKWRITMSFGILGALLMAPAGANSKASDLRNFLIAAESFDYRTPGPLSGLNGGTGWSGPWFTSPLNKEDNRIVTPGMSVAGVAVSGGKSVSPGREIRTFRKIDLSRPELQPLVDQGRLGRDGTTIWFAFLTALSDLPGNSNTGYGSIHLNDGVGDLSQDQFGDKRGHQRVQIGDRNMAVVYFIGRVTNGLPGSSSVDTKVPFDTQTRLVVVRFDFHPGDETYWMFIDPKPGKEPQASTAVATGQMSDFRFDTVQVGSGGSTFPDEHVDTDEIRVGTSFDAVVPVGKKKQ